MTEENLKLFFVKTEGMRSGVSSAPYGALYVLATHPTEAYNKVREFLDINDVGFDSDRELKSIEVVADSHNVPKCDYRLIL